MRFRCPHCKQRTITLAERLKANGYWPRACPQCGGRNTPAAWGILMPVIVFPVALAAPFLIAGSATVAVFWALLATGLVLALVGSVLAYLCIPLLRHGSGFARFEFWSFMAIILGVVLYAALKPESPGPPLFSFTPAVSVGAPLPYSSQGSTGRHFSDAERQEEYKEALAEAKVPFRLEAREDGREFIWVDKEHAAAAKQAERDLWGMDLPPGKANVRFEDPQTTEEFRAWLAARGVPHSVHGLKRKPMIAWDGPDSLTMEFMKSRIPSGPANCDKPAPIAKAKEEARDGRKSCGGA